MAWPIEGDYYGAIQNPLHCFEDPELRSGTLTVTALGLPKPINGAFASVYQMTCAGRRWAVRCFLREFGDQQDRYAKISAHLRAAKLPSMVGFDYLPRGIKVNGTWYPILKMEWIDGEPLNVYIGRRVGQPGLLQPIIRQWVELLESLRKAQIAHGDLQHGNILVSNGQIRLIDYDGMYVPALAGRISHEQGHRNYQHPSRTGHDFNVNIDNFSAWVIFHGLSALTIEPRLWQDLTCGDEHLLFRREDFEKPHLSNVFRTLERGRPELRTLATHFRTLLSYPPSHVPPLDGAPAPNTQPVTPQPPGRGNLPDWLADQVGPDFLSVSDTAPPTGNEAPVGASWLIDHLVERPPLGPVWAPKAILFERLLFMCAVIVPAIFILIAFTHPLLGVSVTLATPSLVLGIFYYRFQSLNLVSEKRAMRAKVEASQVSMLVTDRAVQLTKSDKQKLEEPLRALDEQYRAVHAKMTAELQLLDKDFVKEVTAVENKKRALLQKREAEIDNALSQLNSRLKYLSDEADKVAAQRHQEIAQKLVGIQKEHIENWLRNASVEGAVISGVGPILKRRLLDHGIRTAADVLDWRLRGIEGIGAAKAREILEWREVIELVAKRSMPITCDSTDVFAKYVNKENELKNEINSVRVRIDATRINVTSQYEKSVAHLDWLANDLSAQNLDAIQAVKEKWRRKQIELKEEFERLKIRVAAEQKQKDAQLVKLGNEAFQLQMKHQEAKRELERYRAISFWRYVGRAAG